MRTLESGIGQPNDDLLRELGGRPDTTPSPVRAGNVYHAEYFWADTDQRPGTKVLVEVLEPKSLVGSQDQDLIARVIAASRGPKTADEYRPGEVITIPRGTKLMSQGFIERRRDKVTR